MAWHEYSQEAIYHLRATLGTNLTSNNATVMAEGNYSAYLFSQLPSVLLNPLYGIA